MEKKVKKIEKDEVKEEKKEEIILFKREKRAIKFIALMSAFFATCLSILIFVFSVMATLSAANLSKDVLVNNNILVTLVSKLNGYSIVDTQSLITATTNRLTFIAFEIIIPAIAFIGSMILIIVLAKRVIEFVNDIVYEKDLYNIKKLENSQDIISILSIVLLAMMVIFNKPSIIIYLLIEVLLCIIYLLFKKCVSLRKK